MTDADIIAYIRFWLGDLSTTIISDADMQKLLDIVKLQYPSATECQILYYLAVSVLNWIIRQQAAGSSGSAGSGAVSRRTEKEGSVEITEYYDVGVSGGTASGFDKVLEDLLANPDSIGCAVFPVDPSGGTSIGSVIIGGGDLNGAEAAYDSRMRRDEASYTYRAPSNFPWRPFRY